MSRRVRTIVTAVLVFAWLQQAAMAGPADPEQVVEDHHDPKAAAVAGDSENPWIDLAPSKVLTARLEEPVTRDHKVAASLTLGGIYAGFTTWIYFAWYAKHKPLSEYKWGGDGTPNIFSHNGWFGANQYAGGADKLGHAWATYGLARGGTELLNQWGGFGRLPSSLVGAGLSEALFLLVEVKDGAYYEFSFGDLTFNTLGALLAVAMSNFPRLDELFDYRVEYFPSKAYRDQITHSPPSDCVANDPRKECVYKSSLNIAEDYSGETYLLAFHLGGIHALRDSRYGGWSRFVDVALGFDSRGYKPEPLPNAEKFQERQEMFFGLSLNAQGLFDWLLDGRSATARKITHGLFEMFNAPYSSVRVLEHTQYPSGPVVTGGA
jgi:hypothetical protein